MDWIKIFGLSATALILMAISALLGAVPVYFAWNAAIPALFGLSSITFTQALWLSILCTSLFKSSVSSGSAK